ncbi:DNA-binding domain-containing protein [Ferrovibrio sp.]|uniref:HvfC/BufC N-terminal domain-containing protein n=1 Tax=Ferrovibrio sp. TaxID=1917215 RepID=UPI003D140135
MSRLPELQRDFAAALVGRPSAMAARVVEDAIPASARVQVYADHFRTSLIETLAAAFPVTHALVGEAFFTQAARDFVLRQPPRDPRLFMYGGDFPAALRALRDLAGHPYLPCVAAFEWALHQAYHAEDAVPLRPSDIGDAAAMAKQTLALHPSAQRLDTPWPVSEIWQVHQPDAPAIDSIDLKQGGEQLLLWRNGIELCWRKLNAAEAALIDTVLAGKPLAKAVAQAMLQAQSTGPFDFSASFAWCLEGGIFRRPG